MSKNTDRLSKVEKLKWQYMFSVTAATNKSLHWGVYFDRHLAEPRLSVEETAEKYNISPSQVSDTCYKVLSVLDDSFCPEPTDTAIKEKWRIFSKNNQSPDMWRDWDIYVSYLLARSSFKGKDLGEKYGISYSACAHIFKKVSDRVGQYLLEENIYGEDVLNQYLGIASVDAPQYSASVENVDALSVYSVPRNEALEQKQKIFFEDNRSVYSDRDWSIYVSVLCEEDKSVALVRMAAIYSLHISHVDMLYREVAQKIGPYALEDMVSGDDVLNQYLGVPSVGLDA